MNMKQIYNIIGTDTEIGKTYVTCKLMEDYARKHFKVCGLKPIASGIEVINGQKINPDVYALWKYNNINLPVEKINQICFNLPIAPHIAAKDGELTFERVDDWVQNSIKNITADCIFIEGVGGIMTPLNLTHNYIDLMQHWNFPTILVVGLRLGCLNHALLTLKVLRSYNINVVGFYVNQADKNMQMVDENLQYLIDKLDAPYLGFLRYRNAD